MRLSESQRSAIADSIKQQIKSPYQLFLYGSRADDTQKGGDIDLLLLLEKQSDVARAQREKYKILSNIKSKIGEQKIDLVIFHEAQLGSEPFLDLIYGQGPGPGRNLKRF